MPAVIPTSAIRFDGGATPDAFPSVGAQADARAGYDGTEAHIGPAFKIKNPLGLRYSANLGAIGQHAGAAVGEGAKQFAGAALAALGIGNGNGPEGGIPSALIFGGATILLLVLILKK